MNLRPPCFRLRLDDDTVQSIFRCRGTVFTVIAADGRQRLAPYCARLAFTKDLADEVQI